LVRLREFVMKDLYSFDVDDAGVESVIRKCSMPMKLFTGAAD